MLDTVEIKISSDPKFLKIVRSGVDHLCKICGFNKEVRQSITLAVNEATSNIIKHAYRNAKDKPIIITCCIGNGRLEIVLRDFGIKVNPKNIKSRKLEDVKPGGLGVHIIKSIMDVVIYDNLVKEGNQLTLVKYLPDKEGRNVKA